MDRLADVFPSCRHAVAFTKGRQCDRDDHLLFGAVGNRQPRRQLVDGAERRRLVERTRMGCQRNERNVFRFPQHGRQFSIRLASSFDLTSTSYVDTTGDMERLITISFARRITALALRYPR